MKVGWSGASSASEHVQPSHIFRSQNNIIKRGANFGIHMTYTVCFCSKRRLYNDNPRFRIKGFFSLTSCFLQQMIKHFKCMIRESSLPYEISWSDRFADITWLLYNVRRGLVRPLALGHIRLVSLLVPHIGLNIARFAIVNMLPHGTLQRQRNYSTYEAEIKSRENIEHSRCRFLRLNHSRPIFYF